jgi:hypothetical protein
LCCVAPAFAASADFAIDKPAGHPCPNLANDFRCSIHDQLRPRGFPGCTVYDCFGAGQKIAQHTFGGRDWRTHPELAAPMFAALHIMRALHELLWYLSEAQTLRPSPVLETAIAETEKLTLLDPETLLQLDVPAHRESINALLAATSEAIRAGTRRRDLRGADLIGHDLSNQDLRGANLRGTHLIGTNLTGADLRQADLTGADLRAAKLAGANLSTTIFLTQSQLDAATGDNGTVLPDSLVHPAHWHH